MIWLGACLGLLLSLEMMWRLPVLASARRMTATILSAGRVIMSKQVSDHWKEIALLGYSRRLLETSFRLAVSLLLLVAPLIVLTMLAGGLRIQVLAFLCDWPFLFVGTLVSVIYFYLRSAYGG